MKLLNKVIVAIKSLYLQVYLFLTNFFSNRQFNFIDNASISISLTSYGKRVNRVYLTVESIMAQQGVDVVSITLWLSTQDVSQSNLPKSLIRLEKRGLSIKFIDENIKSYKKIYYEYIQRKNTRNAIIVTADDDVFYPPGWLKALHFGYQKQNNLITCFRGHFMTLDSNHSFCGYSQWSEHFDRKNQLSEVKSLLPTGVGGILYPVRSLKGLDKSLTLFLDNCSSADDIWLKLLCIKNGYGAQRALSDNIHFLPVLSLKMKGLELYNIMQGGNDIQLKKSLAVLGLNIEDFKDNDK